MADTNVVKRTYPWQTSVGGVEMTLRLMEPSDRDTILSFGRSLPDHDLLFLRSDVTDPKVIDEWVENLKKGRTITVMAEGDGGDLLGYASLHHNEVLWTRHVGEIRVMLKPELRGFGLGKALANEVFAIAKDLGLQKVMVQMTTDQRGARGMVESLGFRPEALLADFVMGRDGRTYDLLIMSYDVTGFSDSAETRPRR
ncbi:MAG: acetyltransferase family protein [Dehalococcoidia bacterium]|nr:acetyltransferase family protein [Dehalococcoidia bacterium]